MKEITAQILRDTAKNPTVVNINKDNRKLQILFENSKLTFRGDGALMPTVAEIVQMSYPYQAPVIARPAWYDRNPASQAMATHGNFAPHASTAREYYLCPENRKAIVEYAIMQVCRTTAAAPEGEVEDRIDYAPDGETGEAILRCNIFTNNVGDECHRVIENITLYAGDAFRFYTSDASTGGTVFHHWSYKITEFDE